MTSALHAYSHCRLVVLIGARPNSDDISMQQPRCFPYNGKLSCSCYGLQNIRVLVR